MSSLKKIKIRLKSINQDSRGFGVLGFWGFVVAFAFAFVLAFALAFAFAKAKPKLSKH